MSDEEIQSLLQAQLELPALSNMAIVRCRRAMERVARERLTELGLLSGDQQPPKLKELSTERDMKLLRAQAAGVAREDVDISDVTKMVAGIAGLRTVGPEQIKRIVAVALDGLRPPA